MPMLRSSVEKTLFPIVSDMVNTNTLMMRFTREPTDRPKKNLAFVGGSMLCHRFRAQANRPGSKVS